MSANRSLIPALLAAAALALACSSSDAGGIEVQGPKPQVPDGGWSPNESPDEESGSTEINANKASQAGNLGTGGVSSGGAGPAAGSGGLGGAPAPNLCPGFAIDVPNTVRSSPADSLRMASATRTREELHLDRAPLPASVRGSELENFYATSLTHPTVFTENLMGELEMRETKIAGQTVPGQYDLFVGVEGKPLAVRPPTLLTVLVDTTPTMGAEGLARARAALEAIGNQLQPQDRVRLLTTNDTVGDKLTSPGAAAAEVVEWAQSLALGPEADLVAFFAKAYSLAQTDPDPTGWNRVLVITDGEGQTSQLPQSLIESAAKATPPIFLVGIGVGNQFGESLLYRATSYGRGAYAYLDDAKQADTVLGANFERLFGILYDDVRVTVTAPWYAELLDPGALDPPDVVITANSQYLPPGGLLRFTFRIRLCHPDIVKDYNEVIKPVSLKIDATPIFGAAIPNAGEKLFKFEKLLVASPTTDIEQLAATRAFVSTLRAPTKERFDEATILLKTLSDPQINWQPATEMLLLLGQHPAHPVP